jgi:hypothetical protein
LQQESFPWLLKSGGGTAATGGGLPRMDLKKRRAPALLFSIDRFAAA